MGDLKIVQYHRYKLVQNSKNECAIFKNGRKKKVIYNLPKMSHEEMMTMLLTYVENEEKSNDNERKSNISTKRNMSNKS